VTTFTIMIIAVLLILPVFSEIVPMHHAVTCEGDG
jgi:hypothetical protein